MSISNSLQKRIDELHNLIESSEVELKKLRLVYTYFPDLQVQIRHLRNLRKPIYYSEMVNSVAKDVEIIYSSNFGYYYPIIAMPFVEFNGYKIYSNPSDFIIGNDNKMDEDWEISLKENNISYVVIEKIKAYEEKNRRTDDYDDDDA